MKTIIQDLFGPGTWGAGGNLVAWVLCGIPTFLLGLWHHRRQIRKDLAKFHGSTHTTASGNSPDEAAGKPGRSNRSRGLRSRQAGDRRGHLR